MFGFTLFQGKQRKKIERSVAITNKATLPIKKGYPIASCCNGNIHQGSTLFYDVDGVLHPNDVGNLSCVSHLVSIINKVPSLQLIMSSNWRETMDDEFFERVFPNEILKRTIGFTPVLETYPYRRQREIEAFAAHFGLNRYLCIDDQERLYEPGWPNLYAIDRSRGLDKKSAENIVSYFKGDEE